MKNNQAKNAGTADLPDSNDDIRHLQPDEANLDLPDVKDIPGQEHVHPLPNGEMADTTISSSDEEGEGLFNDDEELELEHSADISNEEKELLRKSSESMATDEDQDI